MTLRYRLAGKNLFRPGVQAALYGAIVLVFLILRTRCRYVSG